MSTTPCVRIAPLPVFAWLLFGAAIGAGAVQARPPLGSGPLLPDAARLAGAPPALRARLAASPIAYFRFVNQAWTREVCAAFASGADGLPTSHLHGDAHVEQYAVTASARGLDDFDDSARGPAYVDIVRFLGSVELTAAERGWQSELPAIVDAFFAGYRRALADSRYLPADPAIVTRLRAKPARSAAEFLSWADSLMRPLTAAESADMGKVWPRVEAYAQQIDGEFTPDFLRRKSAGWLQLGIGSALTRKLLIRIEGPTPAADDDVVLEAKEVSPLREESCLSLPQSAEVFRVIEGLQQVGRLDHRLLVALPMISRRLPNMRGWWVRAWDPSYRELEIASLGSAADLTAIAHDVGAQLGRVNPVTRGDEPAEGARRALLASIDRLEPRIRRVAHEITVALLQGWRTLGSR
jgi:hypothetical protein